MKLITEETQELVVESVLDEQSGKKNYYIEGVFLQAETPNRNNRIYPIGILEREVDRYRNSHILTNRALGELGHPKGPMINLERVSHKIVSLNRDNTNFVGKAKIIETPYGKIAKNFIDEGVKLGVSSRGLGSLSKSRKPGLMEVGDDFHLATPADIVADPSAPEAFVEGIMEGKEWIWDNGILKEREISEIKRKIVRAPKRNLEEVCLNAFSEFLQRLG